MYVYMSMHGCCIEHMHTLHCLSCPYRLSVCEKALSDYLETKRLAFPRFYFISSADLLDILSKGNQPVEVRPVLVFLKVYKVVRHIVLTHLHVWRRRQCCVCMRVYKCNIHVHEQHHLVLRSTLTCTCN